MSRLTYKIVLDPSTFESILVEFTVPEVYGECALGKRRMEAAEAERTWTREEFITELDRYGYGHSAESYIKEKDIYKE